MNAAQKSIAASLAKLDAATLVKVETFLVAALGKSKPAPRKRQEQTLPITTDLSDTVLFTLAKVCGFDDIAKYAKIWDLAFPDGMTQTVNLSPAHKRTFVNGLLSIGATHAKIEGDDDNGLIFPIWKDER